APGRLFCGRPAVVPREDVRERDTQAEVLAAADHPAQIRASSRDGAALRDVVDAALHDEDVGARDATIQPGRDLVGALAVDPVVAELEPPVGPCGPVLPLARLVPAAPGVELRP